MTARPISLPGRELYDPLRKALQSESYKKVDGLLTELEKVCSSTAPGKDLKNDTKSTVAKDELRFWLLDVGRLMFEEKSTDTKQLALCALESAVNHIRTTNYQDQAAWGEMREIISKEYTSLLDTARSEKDPNWHRIWSVLVRIINRDLCQGSSIINMFLSIVEAGFRSPELSIREQSFDCWRLLVEIFANNKQINIPKRVKLICIPLKSSKSKTETIALKKFDIWWFLLCQLRSQLDAMADTIFEPFIYFCFGPSFKTPLCYYFDSSYQELGAPGKMYQSIKQLSAIALIHLLGPASEISKTLLTCSDSCGTQLPFDFPMHGMAISDTLFSSKAKLIIDSCIECTVLLAQMQHLDFLQINRCVWNNLIKRISAETTVPKIDMLQWIKEDMNALLKLCLLHDKDLVLRDILYDTLLTITQSNLLHVNIGYDSPEQLMFNYKTVMSLVLHPQLPCPVTKSEPIVKSLFDLKRHTGQNAYWDILQKTIQYICHADEHSGNNSFEFRSVRTQIYTHLGSYLTAQIRDDMEGYLQHQTTVMSFLLYPLEYDQLLLIESVKELWLQVYEPIAKQETQTCEFVNAFCEMIKAMTIAKHGYSTAVVADALCCVIRSLPVRFEPASSPVKVLELFKDVTRKGLAYKSNLDRIEAVVCCFTELLEKLSTKNILILILPIRNAINELISSEDGLEMIEVRKMLKLLSNKMILPEMTKELATQSTDVKWNCKMLLKTILNLSEDVKKDWKISELTKLMKGCDDKTGNNKTPTRKAPTEEFVVIDKVWNFKPESLTEHQREKMMEKRSDIPALYNDMSQSQDSFVIKPWTPSKGIAAVKQDRTNAKVAATVMDSAILHKEVNNSETSEISTAQNEEAIATTKPSGASKPDSNRLDKENNNGNVLSDETVTTNEQQEHSESEKEKAGEKQQNRKKLSILEKLRIDTVEGKCLDVMNLPRTRRSDVSEKRSTRQKRTSSQDIESEKKQHSSSRTKLEKRSASTSKVAIHEGSQRKERRTSRKTLNFEKKSYSTSSSGSDDKKQTQTKSDVYDDVIESSQSDSSESTNRRISFAKSRAPALADKTNAQSDQCTNTVLIDSTAVQESNVAIMTTDVTSNENKDVDNIMGSVGTEAKAIQSHEKMDTSEFLEPDQQSQKQTAEQAESSVVQKSTQLTIEECASTAMKHELPRSGLAQKLPAVLSSPSRRSARLSLDEGSKINNILSPRKITDKKCLYSPSKSIHKPEVKEKGTPSKKATISCDDAMREALKFVGSSNSHTHEGEECGFVENRSGLSSPKVARFSPLVVLESIKNIAKTLQDAEEHETEAVSHPIILPMEAKEQDENFAGSNAQQTATSVKHHLPIVDSSTNAVEMIGDKTKESSGEPLFSLEQAPGEPGVVSIDQLSPVKNLDEEMEPLNKSLNRSIVSSPDHAGEEERNADLLNSTLNISPISEEKGLVAKSVDPGELAGSADRRSSNRLSGRERDIMVNAANTPVSTLMTRRSKASPTPQTPSGSTSAFKARTQQQSSLPRSPRTNMLGLGGRGAQLINLIRNQHNDQSPKPNTSPQNASTPKGGLGSASGNSLMMRKKAIVGNATSIAAESSTSSEQLKHSEENCQEKSAQYLFFSKALPSPLASPANSILKRKHNQDESVDDIESPVNKRKRVSFHDPPVSLTKEYIRQAEECRSASVSRSLQLPGSITSSADRTKFMLRRKSKSDSISELQCFTITQTHSSKVAELATNPNRANEENMEEVEITSSPESLDEHEFMMHDATDNMTALHVTSDCMDVSKKDSALSTQSENAPEEELQHVTVAMETVNDSPNKISFSSEDALMEHVLSQYTLDDIFERYISAGKSLERAKSVRTLTKELSAKMSEDTKIRDVVLDELSERHSVEFLDHAIQENSNAKVCERLSATTMLDYVFKQLQLAYNTQGPADQTSGRTENEKDETLRVVENIFENLLSLPSTEADSQHLAALREQFLRKELARKNRLEIMSLLENYFKISNTM